MFEFDGQLSTDHCISIIDPCFCGEYITIFVPSENVIWMRCMQKELNLCGNNGRIKV